jgi:predicted subunit of tRNA(5-methylaminomethyl-2-thiouridylate) methyltransferase
MSTNFIEITGTVKNVKSFSGSRGTMVTAWFTQRITDPIEMTVLNVGVIAKKPSVAEELAKLGEGTHEVTVIGRLLTNVIRKPNTQPEYRTQVEVDELTINA